MKIDFQSSSEKSFKYALLSGTSLSTVIEREWYKKKRSLISLRVQGVWFEKSKTRDPSVCFTESATPYRHELRHPI